MDSAARRTRTPRTYPASSFLEALPLAKAIQDFAAGQRIRRLTLFDHMQRNADSGPSRQLVTNSGQYGLTNGGYRAEFLELTPEGALASGDESLGRARIAARLELALARIEPFNALLMMNSELVSAAEVRAVIPTVYRNNYLAALRAASHNFAFDALYAAMSFARRYTAKVDFTDRGSAERDLERTNALLDPNLADTNGIRLLMP